MLGHTLTILSFSGALLALVAYTLFTQTKDLGWRTLARAAFRVHSIAILGIVVTLFTMLFNHWFAYDYVWKHSNTEMPLRYIASCFWEGQEGSFLLWTFWTMVLGNLLIWKAKTWEGPVLAVFALVQVFLATMLLGMGMNPFPKKARKLLDAAGIAYKYLEYGNYLNTWRERNALKLWTGWPTFPMVFVKGMLVGGANDLKALIANGEMKTMLAGPRTGA